MLYELDKLLTFNLCAKHNNRKEVIQEQLPLPLPCYDLALVTDPTVSLQENRGIRVLPAPLA